VNDQGAPRRDTAERTGREEVLFLLAALALAALVALPAIAGPGIVNTRGGGDSPFLVLRTHQMEQALRSGAFPARWMADAALGLGYPAFTYYAALPYYLSAAASLSGLGALGGIKLAQLIGFLLAGGAAYGLARALDLRRPGALLASVAYSYAPFHLVNMYVRGDALSEFYAMGLFPLALLQAVLLMRRPGLMRALALAVTYAALACTHNISAMLASPLLVLWIIGLSGQAPSGRRRWALLLGGGALALGLALSAWFWLPALAERDLVQLVDQTTGYFHFAGHFRGWDLVQRRLIFDYTLTGGQDPFRMGLVQTVATAMGLGAWIWRWRSAGPLQRAGGALLIICWAGATFLMTAASHFVWEVVPLLAYTQFPWRLLALQALFGALAIGRIPEIVAGRRAGGRWGAALAGIVSVALMATAVGGLKVDRLTLREGDVTAQRLMLYEAYSGNLGGTVRYEFLPATMRPRPYASTALLTGREAAAPYALAGELGASQLLALDARSQNWRVSMQEPGWIAFQVAAFPGWSGMLDGAVQGVTAEESLGLLKMEVPAGEHVVSLALGRTRVELWSERASLLALLAAAGIVVAALAKRPEWRWTALNVATALLLAATAVLFCGRFGPDLAEGDGPLVMDYVRSPYLHRLDGGLRMGPATLREYELSATTLAPVGVLTFSGRMEGVPAGAAMRLEMVALTAHLFPGSPAWAVAEESVAAGAVAFEVSLQLPTALPPGLYALRPVLAIDGVPQQSTTSEGTSLGLVALEPVRVLDQWVAVEAPPTLASFGPPDSEPEITLRELRCGRVGDRVYQVDMLWRSERQARRNYQLSVRLMRGDGSQMAARDLPPLAGNYPTSLWQATHLYTDSLRIELPEDADPAQVADVQVVLYDGLTLAAAGSVAVPVD